MADTLRHRGPDDSGEWVDPHSGVALGFRRLSILDLSERGHQPMVSSEGRFCVIFNGEIYNHGELRGELERAGAVFRGSSDTEVMLAAFSRWGVEGALPKLNGMFALAAWDREDHVLYLARDRMGEKPLYYGWVGRSFAFGSELKALQAHPEFTSEIDREALTLFFRHKYVPAPWSIFRGISKLMPGTWLALRHGDARPGMLPAERPYWSVAGAVERGLNDPFVGTDEECAEELDALLKDAVSIRMQADVPLGAFLSGGVDSSTVVALMQEQSQARVKTFTIGVLEPGYDESTFARGVASHLGTEHTDITVTPQEARDVIPLLPTLYDEPFGDSSQIPTYLVSRLAVKDVTVALSGDGGDEVFGGYNRYRKISSVWSRVGWLPAGARSAAAKAMAVVPAQAVDRMFQRFPGFARGEAAQRPGDKLQKLARALDASTPDDMYRRLVSHWDPPAPLVVGGREPPLGTGSGPHGLGPAERAMYLDSMTYLPDDILAKVDRASMGVSLEARVPLLDHRVVEFAWRLPLRMKVRGGVGKWLLRRVLDDYVPRTLIDRPKAGFGVPISDWLRGPLRPWAEELLEPSRLASEGFVHPALVRRRWTEHQSGRHNWQYPLWDVLMFQAWLEAQKARFEVPTRSIRAR